MGQSSYKYFSVLRISQINLSYILFRELIARLNRCLILFLIKLIIFTFLVALFFYPWSIIDLWHKNWKLHILIQMIISIPLIKLIFILHIFLHLHRISRKFFVKKRIFIFIIVWIDIFLL